MLHTLAVANYRSLRELIVPLGQLTLITGPNGSGKSNLYRAVRLLREVALGGAVQAIARQGGLASVLWAGPESFSREVKRGELPVEGGRGRRRVRVRIGLADEALGYAIDFGLPVSRERTVFSMDPQIKRECIWAGGAWRPSATLVDRKVGLVRSRGRGDGWEHLTDSLQPHETMLTELTDPQRAPEVLAMRAAIRGWRFYDHFRTDADAPARQPGIGTRTDVLSQDGHDLVAALETIREVGDAGAVEEAVADAFDGARIETRVHQDGRFELAFHQRGLLRPLSQAELSDGTLRYLLLVAALLTPRPPALMVLNEPETSLHPDLLGPLSRLVVRAAQASQIWVVSHAKALTNALSQSPACVPVILHKELGETRIVDETLLSRPAWTWPLI